MSEWQPIETAPKDGTPVKAGKVAKRFGGDWIPYPLTSRFIDDQWCCDMGDRWCPYDPQPSHWMPLPAAPTAPAPQHDAGEG